MSLEFHGIAVVHGKVMPFFKVDCFLWPFLGALTARRLLVVAWCMFSNYLCTYPDYKEYVETYLNKDKDTFVAWWGRCHTTDGACRGFAASPITVPWCGNTVGVGCFFEKDKPVSM